MMRMECGLHLPPELMTYIPCFQYLAQSKSRTRRGFAVPPPSMRRAHRRTLSQNAKCISHLISYLSAIHVRPPPYQYQTAPRPPPDKDQGRGLIEHPTSNIQHRTSNGRAFLSQWVLGVRCWLLDVPGEAGQSQPRPHQSHPNAC